MGGGSGGVFDDCPDYLMLLLLLLWSRTVAAGSSFRGRQDFRPEEPCLESDFSIK